MYADFKIMTFFFYGGHFASSGCQLPYKASAYGEKAGAFEPGSQPNQAWCLPFTAGVQQ